MRFKIALMSCFLYLFSLFICQESTFNNDDTIFNVITRDNVKILECGVKVQYFTHNNMFDELTKIKSILNISENNVVIKEQKENSLYIEMNKDGTRYVIKGSTEDDLKAIELEIIKNTKDNDIENLKRQLIKVQDNTSIKPQYYSYIKGRIVDDKKDNIEVLETKLITNGATEVKTIPINSGFTGVAKFKDNSKLNYAICRYDRETYLIIGTPIIFTTF
ncbi:membrane protein [Clostridium polyendosporum]|uniref:Membrane protein n=1 Tax=Clostridium polyendosporum TaxID=69208 RepID=A0A919S055_9CLOT|nr:hypothetical protein [Clostridium polyendosporum]GIM29682.1 membrane protein [Clostridium polyendosporum]